MAVYEIQTFEFHSHMYRLLRWFDKLLEHKLF